MELLRTLAKKGPGFLEHLGSFLDERLSQPELGELVQSITSVLERKTSRQSRITPGRLPFSAKPMLRLVPAGESFSLWLMFYKTGMSRSSPLPLSAIY